MSCTMCKGKSTIEQSKQICFHPGFIMSKVQFDRAVYLFHIYKEGQRVLAIMPRCLPFCSIRESFIQGFSHNNSEFATITQKLHVCSFSPTVGVFACQEYLCYIFCCKFRVIIAEMMF